MAGVAAPPPAALVAGVERPRGGWVGGWVGEIGRRRRKKQEEEEEDPNGRVDACVSISHPPTHPTQTHPPTHPNPPNPNPPTQTHPPTHPPTYPKPT